MLTGTRRTVLMLAGCQALSMTGGSIVGLTGAIVGNMLTPDKALSTLPIAVQQAGVMAATIPAALLMARIGRRPGFWLGTAIGGVGAVIATWAIFRSSFEWFCFGTFLLGANRGATQQYRFAAAEIADKAFRSKGGVVSAVFGAEVAKWSRDLFQPVLFAGCYALILVLFLASAVLLYFVELPRPATPVLAGGGGDDRLWRHVAGDDCDADRDARLRARICRRRFGHPVALARHVRSELCHRPPDHPPRVDADHACRRPCYCCCAALSTYPVSVPSISGPPMWRLGSAGIFCLSAPRRC
jgi:hypothetical protein